MCSCPLTSGQFINLIFSWWTWSISGKTDLWDLLRQAILVSTVAPSEGFSGMILTVPLKFTLVSLFQSLNPASRMPPLCRVVWKSKLWDITEYLFLHDPWKQFGPSRTAAEMGVLILIWYEVAMRRYRNQNVLIPVSSCVNEVVGLDTLPGPEIWMWQRKWTVCCTLSLFAPSSLASCILAELSLLASLWAFANSSYSDFLLTCQIACSTPGKTELEEIWLPEPRFSGVISGYRAEHFTYACSLRVAERCHWCSGPSSQWPRVQLGGRYLSGCSWGGVWHRTQSFSLSS